MRLRPTSRLVIQFLLAGVCICGGAPLSFPLALDTSHLLTSGDPFQLEFFLTGGSGNTATLNSFGFGGGSGAFTPVSVTGVSVNAAKGSITLTNTSGNFGPAYSLNFIAGSQLSFVLSSTDNGPAPFFPPDEIALALVDSSGARLPTNQPNGGNSLLILDLTGRSDTPILYTGTSAELPSGFLLGGGGGSGGSAPEAGTSALCGVGLLLAAAGLRRHRKTLASRVAKCDN